MSCSPVWFNHLLILTLLVNLVPWPRQAGGYATGTAAREMALTAEALPAWFAVPGNTPAAGLFLPVIESLDYEARESEARRLPGGASRAPQGQGLRAVAYTLDAASRSDGPPPVLDTGRGYYPHGLRAYFGFFFPYTQPIDFNLDCTGEISSSYESCKLHPNQPRGDYYTGSWRGQLLVPAEGVYTFWLSSTLEHRRPDDNARLSIDGAQVADWWWNAPPRSPATTTLSAGLHYITIAYGQWAASLAALQVRWAGPGFEAEVIPVYGFPDDGPACPNPQNEEGGPVNTKSGNYIYQASDLQLQTLAGPLSFERTYSAQDVDRFSAGLLGYGWTHNHDRRLVFPDDPGGETGTVILRGADGSSSRFWQVELGAGEYRYEPRPEVRADMVEVYDVEREIRSYIITASDQSVLTFNEGQPFPATYRDPQGNVLTYTYHSGWLSRVSDANGRYLEFDVAWVEGLGDGEDELWTGGERLVQVRDHSGHTVNLGYYAGSGDLAVVTDTRGFAWTHVYSGATHWLSEVRDPYGQVIEQNEYDAWGRVGEQSNGLGQKITFEYQVDTTSRTTVTFPLGQVLVDVYDSRNTLVRQERQGTNENVSGYDGTFNRSSTTDARGNTTSYTWDQGGCSCNLDSVVDAQGRRTTFEYDGRNNLTRVVNPQGYSTTYEYDEQNNPITITDALEGMTVNRYDASGNLVRTTRNGAYTMTYAYDHFGQRIATTDTQGLVTRYGYDQWGQMVAVTTPQGITRYAYDAAGHTVAITRGYALTEDDGQWTDTVFDERVTRYGFDAVGRQTRVTETVPLPGGGVEQRVTRT